jgi:tetratricopeptide (TPR) repeat protein
VLAYVRLRRHREAVMLIEKMLAYNPNDNQGMRYLLGSEALRAGEHERAQKVFAAEAESYPPYFYELALTHALKDEWIPAATALRHGFCANPYIAEILGGNPHPQPLAIWHGSNLAEPETAVDYVEMYGDLWRRRPDSLTFVRWLFNHPKVMVERAAFMDCREALLWEQDFQARTTILDREREVLAGIDDRLSATLVVKRQDRRGRTLYPWMLAFGA